MKILLTGGAGFIGSNLDEITDHPNLTFMEGDIPHSQASILKAKTILNYNSQYSAKESFAKACEWYFKNLK